MGTLNNTNKIGRKAMLRSLFAVVILGLLTTACSGTKSQSVSSLQKRDKNLSCKEIMLEQNEAAFYRKTAENNKGPSVKNVMMPLGYISTFVSAENAIEAANSRIDYLNRIYDILDCDNPAAEANNRPPMGVSATNYGYHDSRNPYKTQAAAYNHSYGGTYTDEWYW